MMYKPAVLSSREYNGSNKSNYKNANKHAIINANNNISSSINNSSDINKDKSMTPSFSFTKELQLLKMSAHSVPSTLLHSPPEEPAKPCKTRRMRNSNKKSPYCFKTLETVEFVGEEFSQESSDHENIALQKFSMSGSNNNSTNYTLPMLSNQIAPSLPNLLTSPSLKNDKQRNNCEVQVHWLEQDLSLDIGFSVKSAKDASLSNITCESSIMTTESSRKRPLTLLERRRSSRGKITELSGLCMEAITCPTEVEMPTMATPPHVTFRGWTKASRSRMTTTNTSSSSTTSSSISEQRHQYIYCSEHSNASQSNDANVHYNDEVSRSKANNDAELQNKNGYEMSKQMQSFESTFDVHEFNEEPHLSSSWQTSLDCQLTSSNMRMSTNNSITCNNGYGYEDNHNSKTDCNTSIRVVCYNILADRLVNTDRYRSCPLHVLNEEYRIALIKEEVKLAAPDIFIAEEISESVFHKTDSLGDFLRNELHLHGELITITDMSGNPHHRALESQSLSQTWLPAEEERAPKVTGVEPVIVPSSTNNNTIHMANELNVMQGDNCQSNSSKKSSYNNSEHKDINIDSINEKMNKECEDTLVEKCEQSISNEVNDSVTVAAMINEANDGCIDYKDACDATCDSPLVLSSFRLNRKYEYDNNNTEALTGNAEKSNSNDLHVHNSEGATMTTTQSSKAKVVDSGANCSAIANNPNDSYVEEDSSMLRSEMDGVAIFFNTERFTLLEKVPIYFNRIAMEESHLLTAYERRKLRVSSHNVAMICVLKDRHVPTHIYLIAAVHLIWHREECQMWQCHHLLNTLERLKAKYSAMTSELHMTSSGFINSLLATTEEGKANTYEQCKELLELEEQQEPEKFEQKYEEEEEEEEKQKEDKVREKSLYHVTCIIGGDYNVEKNSAVFDYIQHGVLHKSANVFQSWQQALRQDAEEHSTYTDSFETNSMNYVSKEKNSYRKDKHKSKDTIKDKKPSFMTTEALEQLERNNANEFIETRRATSLNYANFPSLETASLPCPLTVHTPLAAFARKSRRTRNEMNSTVNTNEIESDATAVDTAHDTTTSTSENTALVSATATKSGVESSLGEETSSECYPETQFSILSCDNPLYSSNHTPSSHTRHENKMYEQGKLSNVELPNLHVPTSRSVTPTMLSITPVISPTCTATTGASNSPETENTNAMLASFYNASLSRNNSITCNELCKNQHAEHQQLNRAQPQACTHCLNNITSSSCLNSAMNTGNTPNTWLLCSSPLSQRSQASHSRLHRVAAAANAAPQATLESSIKRQSSIEMEVVGHSLLRSPQLGLQLPSNSSSHHFSARSFLPIPVNPANISPPIVLALQSPSSVVSSQQTSPVPTLRSSHSKVNKTHYNTRSTRSVKLSLSATATASTANKIVKIAHSGTSPHNVQRTPSLEPNLLSSFTTSQRSAPMQPSPTLLPESIYMPVISERAASNNIFSDNATSPSETPICNDKNKLHSPHAEVQKYSNNKSNYPPLLFTPLLTSSMTSTNRFMSLPSPSSLLPPPSHVAQATLSPSSPFCINDYSASSNKVNNMYDITLTRNECAIRSPSIECVSHTCNVNKANDILTNNNNNSNRNSYNRTTTSQELGRIDKNCTTGKNNTMEVEHASTPFTHTLSFSDAYAYYCHRHRSKVSAVQPPSMNEGKVIDHILYENNYVTCVGVLRLGNVAVIPSPTVPSDHYMIGAIFTPVQVEHLEKETLIKQEPPQQKQAPIHQQKRHIVGSNKQKRMLASTVR